MDNSDQINTIFSTLPRCQQIFGYTAKHNVYVTAKSLSKMPISVPVTLEIWLITVF